LKKVLFFSHSQALGGAELSMLEIMARIDRSKFQPVLVSPGTGMLSARAGRMGLEIVEVALPPALLAWHRDSRIGMGTLLAAGRSIIILSKRIKQAGPAIIYSHSQKAHILGGLAGRLAGAPVVWHLRDVMPRPGLKALESWLGNWLPQRMIAVSRTVSNRFGRAGLKNKIRVIPNGLDVDAVRRAARMSDRNRVRRDLNIDPGLPLVGMVGRVAPWKGQHVFIRAARAIADECPRARFLVIGGPLFGEEDYYNGIIRLAEGLGLKDRLFFTGHREDVYPLMASLDVMVHCSLAPEPFGRVVAEAMALRVPVVSVCHGGITELVTDRVSGLLVPPGHVVALSRAVVELIERPWLRRTLVRAAAEQIERCFRLETTVSKIEEILKEV